MQNAIYFTQDFRNSDAVIIFAKSSKFISCTESCTRKAICPNLTAISVFSLSSSNNITSSGRIFRCSLLYSLVRIEVMWASFPRNSWLCFSRKSGVFACTRIWSASLKLNKSNYESILFNLINAHARGDKKFQYCSCPAGRVTYHSHSSCKNNVMHLSFKSVCNNEHLCNTTSLNYSSQSTCPTGFTRNYEWTSGTVVPCAHIRTP